MDYFGWGNVEVVVYDNIAVILRLLVTAEYFVCHMVRIYLPLVHDSRMKRGLLAAVQSQSGWKVQKVGR
jgi:hypothetical protein